MRPIFKTLPAATVGMLLFVGALLLVSQMVRAQVAGQGGQAGGQAGQAGGQAGQAGQAGGTGVAGIYVDADGVVSLVFPRDKTGLLDAKRRAELAGQTLPTEVNRTSALRKVSLLKLEQVLQDYADRREHVPDELQFLAGLQRIDYLFVDPEGKDLIIAGPAEGFVVDSFGRGLGVQTGRPTLRLDDLVIAFRTVLRGSPVGCSIDPDETRLAQLKSFVAQNSGAATSQVAKSRLEQMPRILGLQNVRTFGVPPESHFAQVLVEADYRMKRLCLGLDTAPVKGFKSHLAMIAPGGNTMQRWWFTPYYEPFVRSEDGLAIRIAGQRVQLLAQEEFVSDTGKRSDSAFSPVSLQKYAQLFTEKYPGLAAAMPVMADLQNLFDLLVVAALIKKDGLDDKIGWQMSLILDEEKLTLAKWNVPRQVQTLLNYKSTNRSVYIGLIGGGVEINPRRTLERAKFQAPPDTQLGQTYKASLKPSPAGESPAAASPPQVPSAKKVKGAAAPTAAPRSTTETIRWWWD